MRPSQCRKGMRVYVHSPAGETHGVITRVRVIDAGGHRVRRVFAIWDGFAADVEVDPADLKREIPAPIGDREALERWLNS